ELHLRGVPIDWNGVDRDYVRRKVRLPTYPFRGERFMVERRDGAPAAPEPALHPLLGRRVRSPSLADIVFETRLDAGSLRYVRDHRVFERAVLPATAYLEAATAAAAIGLGEGAW